MRHPRVEAHRRDLNELVRLAQNDLRLIFTKHDDPIATRDTLLLVLPRLVQLYGAAAATLAADWYDDLRADAAVRGRFTVITAELPDLERTDALARWGVGPLFSATPDKLLAFGKTSGGLQRIIANADRQTVTTSSIEDRHAQGWTRVTDGGCDFCQSLADIVVSEGGADFESHDHCSCVAAPIFG